MTEPDLPYARPHWDAEEAVALMAALESGFWTNGSQVVRFEEELKRITGAPTVTMASGTSAIFALLHTLGRSVSGPKLLVSPTLNFAAGAASAKLLGWDIALCDVAADDLTLCPASLGDLLERVHGDYAKIVVLPVHYAGHSADMAALSAQCERYGADLVEDACHAVGGSYDGVLPVGSWPTSVAAYFSFHPTKPIAAGEGGAVSTADPDLLDELRLVRNHNMSPVDAHTDDHGPWPYSITVPGMNLRLSEFNAAVGAVQAGRAEESRLERARLVACYQERLDALPFVRAVPRRQRAGSAHHLFPVVFDVEGLGMSKKDLLCTFFSRGIRCQVHYTPLHRLPAFAGIAPRLRTSFTAMDAAFPGLVSLPLWRGMTDGDCDRVIGVVTEIVHRSTRALGRS
ncbi:DegT/DnrJ/EryC1/StrS family aminotransferase [Streptomyces sp. NBC_00879]|uniref:DegT/DnrJ/EryC1/StrS family aminotransferase n=1 Tax=Streptomyces sp. NBC_00879 TaxID=2975855 RepID=UPI0038694025|nr:DegT/DnrJ/EryC1/StrS family aminotransferase [Streptomyces sp. NBC_00879]